MKILLIGGSGTLSSAVRDRLLDNPSNALTLLTRGHRPLPERPNLKTLVADINDFVLCDSIIGDETYDCVINFVCYTQTQAEENLKLFRSRTRQFIFISTVAVLDHEAACVLNETSATGNRFSVYGQNKAAAESLYLDAFRNNGFPVTIVRPAQTYSEDRIPLSVKGKTCYSVIDRMVKGKPVIIHGDGQSVWVSTHADDFAQGLIGLIGNPSALGEIVHIMNPTPHTWDQVYRILGEALQVEVKPVYLPSRLLSGSKKYDHLTSIQGDKMFSCLYDVSKLKRLVPGYEPIVSLKQGLEDYLTYMDLHTELKVSDPDYDDWCDTLVYRYSQATKDLLEGI